MRRVSDKRRGQNEEYLAAKKAVGRIVRCWICGVAMTVEGSDFHHTEGREGGKLLGRGVFLCRPHHRWVEENRAEAAEMGLLRSREGLDQGMLEGEISLGDERAD